MNNITGSGALDWRINEHRACLEVKIRFESSLLELKDKFNLNESAMSFQCTDPEN